MTASAVLLQEYTMLSKSGQVYGWPHGGYPAPQGPFYCGVGSESVYGRPLAEAHMDACMKAGLQYLASSIEQQIHPGLLSVICQKASLSMHLVAESVRMSCMKAGLSPHVLQSERLCGET